MDLEAAIRLHYDTFAVEYDGVDQGVESVLSRLKKVPAESSILDIGCGTGNLTLRLPEINSFQRVVGIDLSHGVLNIARKRAQELGLRHFNFLRANACQLPFDDEEFDCVVSNMVFHLVSDRRKALAEIVRVLKPSGSAVLQFIGGGHVVPDMLEIVCSAWNEILPEENSSNLLYEVLVEKKITIEQLEQDMANLGIDSFEISWRRNLMRIEEPDVSRFLEFFKLVGGFWRWGTSKEAAETIRGLITEQVKNKVTTTGYFPNTVNILLTEFAKP